MRRYAADPGVDLLRLFRQMLFSWWIGNGDLHLKNLALLSRDPTRPRLSPAYDLLSTSLVIMNDPLALPVRGKKSDLDRADWLVFADYCGLPRKLAELEIDRLPSGLAPAQQLLGASFLRDEFRAALAASLEARSLQLARSA